MPFQKLTTSQKMLLGGLFIGFGCIGIGFASNLYFPDSDYNFLGKKDRQRLAIDRPLTQVFTSKEAGLSGVKYSIGNINLWPGEALQFELRDAACQKTLATDSWTPLQPKPLIYTRFHFPRIADSQGQTYCAYITYTSSYDRKSSDAPHINTSEFPGRSYTLVAKNKVYENETLQIRPAYSSGNFFSDLWRLVERMSQYKPNLIKGIPLLILMTLVFLGSLSLCIWIILAK
ncbi:MAG: hypothetical protein AAB845_00205, partial [Patescibacteria group bacterium]